MSHRDQKVHQGHTGRTLYVIAVISNPVRYESRIRLYKEFAERMANTPHVKLITVEHAFGDRPFDVTSKDNPDHVQLRGGPEYELWLKEPMMNRGFKHLYEKYPNWQYAAWIDADVEFSRTDWAEETLEALQHYKIVQPWSHSLDLGPNHELVGKPARSFLSCYVEGVPPMSQYGGEYWHAGYAWAIRRDAMDGIKKFIDWCPMGAGDHHMAWAFVGDIWSGVHGQMGVGYKRKAAEFQALCDQYIQKDVGYVPGTLLHHWHGSKKKRYYVERWSTLVETKFDPYMDIAFDKDGMPFLVGNKPELRDALRRYFRARNEDGIDLD
jgi:hypothetical protein